MILSDLNKEYDKLQKKYGDKRLDSIYNGGLINNPDICFVFMNPTGRNIATSKEWHGIKAPWIGTKNVWNLFYKLNVIDDDIPKYVRDNFKYDSVSKSYVYEHKDGDTSIVEKYFKTSNTYEVLKANNLNEEKFTVNLENERLVFRNINNNSLISNFDYSISSNKCLSEECNNDSVLDFINNYWKNLEIN